MGIINKMENHYQKLLKEKIQELLHIAIQTYNSKNDDSVTLKSIKLFAVGHMLQEFGLSWDYILKLFKTHTPIHPKNVTKLLEIGDEEALCVLSQIFVKNEKLVRLIKNLSLRAEIDVDEILAIDGLAGNISNAPNFEQKHYIGNLRFANLGDSKFFFDEESEHKRLHVQIVREMYKMMKNVPVPSKHVYDILRKCYYQTLCINLPEITFNEEEEMDGELEGQIAKMYLDSMGKDNMSNFVKNLRIRGEKRVLDENEDLEKPEYAMKLRKMKNVLSKIDKPV